MKKILILTAGFGDGHNAAARSLRDAIELLDEDARAEVLDLFADSYGAFNTLARKPISAWCNTRPASGAAFIRCWKIPSSKTARQFHRACKRCWKKSWPRRSRTASSPPTRSTATSSRRFITAITSARSVHHRRHRFHHHQLRVVPRAERLLLRGQRRLRRSVPQGRRRGKTNQGARLSGQPRFRRTPSNCRRPSVTNRAACFTSSTPARKRPARRLTGCSNSTMCISPSPPDATPNCAPSSSSARAISDRVKVLGWTNQMPELMMSHHLVISKAGGATVQEAIAARCPMIVNQVIPGQEEGNAELIWRYQPRRRRREKPRGGRTGRKAFAKRAALWHEWRENLKKISAGPTPRCASRTHPRRGRPRHAPAARPSNCLKPRRTASCVRARRGNGEPCRRCCSAISTSTRIIPTANSPCRRLLIFTASAVSIASASPTIWPTRSRLLGKLSELANCTLAQEQIGGIFRRHRARTPARVAPLQDARDDRHRIQQGRLHAQNLRAPARH
jgi:processive 1,2-diacylglycerol beta-glucosyltransferase